MPYRRKTKNRKGAGRPGGNPDIAKLGKDFRFVPGQPSANPGGRPRIKVLSEAYRMQLEQPVPGDPQGRSFAELIASMMVREALTGSVGAAQELADRTEGKATQFTQSTVVRYNLTASDKESADRTLELIRSLEGRHPRPMLIDARPVNDTGRNGAGRNGHE